MNINKLRKITDDVLGLTGTRLDVENETCKECFGKKDFTKLNKTESELCVKIMSYIHRREMRVIQAMAIKYKLLGDNNEK